MKRRENASSPRSGIKALRDVREGGCGWRPREEIEVRNIKPGVRSG